MAGARPVQVILNWRRNGRAGGIFCNPFKVNSECVGHPDRPTHLVKGKKGDNPEWVRSIILQTEAAYGVLGASDVHTRDTALRRVLKSKRG